MSFSLLFTGKELSTDMVRTRLEEEEEGNRH
jgi:hypothetical protein